MNYERIYESTFSSQHCFDQCLLALSAFAAAITSGPFTLQEATLMGQSCVDEVDAKIQDAARWVKRLHDGFNEHELVADTIRNEIRVFNTIKTKHILEVLHYVFTESFFDDDDREFFMKRCIQYKQVVDALRVEIQRYMDKTHIDDPSLLPDDVVLPLSTLETNRKRVYESTFSSQHCFDQCLLNLSKFGSLITSGILDALEETTLSGIKAVDEASDAISRAALWLRRLSQAYDDNELIQSVIRDEVETLNDITTAHILEVLRYVFEKPKFDADDRKAYMAKCVQYKQVVDTLKAVLQRYMNKMHIDDPSLLPNDVILPLM